MENDNTTPPTVSADDGEQSDSLGDLATAHDGLGHGPAGDDHRRRWPWILGLGMLGTAFLAVAFVAFVNATVVGVDEYVLSPGSASDTAGAITVNGADSFVPEGQIAYTTVAIKREVKVLDWLRAKWSDSDELVPREQIDGTRTREETRTVTQFQMRQSQDTATLVALEYLGYELEPAVDGAFVTQLVEGAPAAESLQLGDLIVAIDDTEIRSSEGLGEAVRSLAPGDTIEVVYQRAPEGSGGDGSSPDAVEGTANITLAQHPDIEGSGFIGVVIETPVRANAPFDVAIDVGRVRGPSAGLAFSLSILDVLTEGELTGGMAVATTGTIDRFGNVGRVGGVPQKTEAANRAGIDVFLVPPSEYEEAVAGADDDLMVRCVQTFDDAVLTLAELGGNGIEVAEAAGADLPEYSLSPIDPDDGFLSCAEVTGEPREGPPTVAAPAEDDGDGSDS